MRTAAVLAGLMLLGPALLLLPAPSTARNILGHHPSIGAQGFPLVAIIDTGIAPIAEFENRIVAWWDFGSRARVPGQVTDTLAPQDSCSAPSGGCRGTMIASRIAGATVGIFPEARIAAADVYDDTGAVPNFTVLHEAFRWAVFDVGADIVQVVYNEPADIPTEVPPAILDRPDDFGRDFADARDVGVLTILALGSTDVYVSPQRGLLRATGLGELSPPGKWPNTLLVVDNNVSADPLVRLQSSQKGATDPDVAANGHNITVKDQNNVPRQVHGPAFAAATATGAAARVLKAAIAGGQNATPERIEKLLSHTARDDLLVPYLLEGWGTVDQATVQAAAEAAFNGTLPPANSPANELASRAADHVRNLSHASGESGLLMVQRGTGEDHRIGTSLTLKHVGHQVWSQASILDHIGVSDAEVYYLPGVSIGDNISVALRYTPLAFPGGARNDLDVFLYRPPLWLDASIYGSNYIIASNTTSPAPGLTGQVTESLRARAFKTGPHLLVVQGMLVGDADQAFMLTVRKNGVLVTPSFVQDYLAIDPPDACDLYCRML